VLFQSSQDEKRHYGPRVENPLASDGHTHRGNPFPPLENGFEKSGMDHAGPTTGDERKVLKGE